MDKSSLTLMTGMLEPIIVGKMLSVHGFVPWTILPKEQFESKNWSETFDHALPKRKIGDGIEELY